MLFKFHVLKIITLLIVISLLFAAGCSSTGKTQLYKTPSSVLSGDKVVSVEVLSKVAGSNKAQEQLEGSIVGKLRQKKLFERVYSRSVSTDNSYDLKINVTIIKLRKVNPDSRFWLGVFAGQGRLEADVEIIDAKTNEALGQAKVKGKTSGGSALAGTTPQAVERVAEQVAEFVAEFR